MKTLKLDAFNNYCFFLFETEPNFKVLRVEDYFEEVEEERYRKLDRMLRKQNAIYILKAHRNGGLYLNNVALKYPQSRNIEIPPRFWRSLLNATDVKIYRFGEGKIKFKSSFSDPDNIMFIFDNIPYYFHGYNNKDYIVTSQEQKKELDNFFTTVGDYLIKVNPLSRNLVMELPLKMTSEYDADLIFDWDCSVLDFRSLFGTKIKGNELVPNLSLYITIDTKTELRNFLLDNIEPVFDGSEDRIDRVLFDPRALLLQF